MLLLYFQNTKTIRTRGQHPNDAKLFSEKNLSKLQAAVNDFSLLLTMGYPVAASLKLVGDHFRLNK